MQFGLIWGLEIRGHHRNQLEERKTTNYTIVRSWGIYNNTMNSMSFQLSNLFLNQGYYSTARVNNGITRGFLFHNNQLLKKKSQLIGML